MDASIKYGFHSKYLRRAIYLYNYLLTHKDHPIASPYLALGHYADPVVMERVQKLRFEAEVSPMWSNQQY